MFLDKEKYKVADFENTILQLINVRIKNVTTRYIVK